MTEKGTVTITKGKVQVEIIGKDETVVYDGEPHTAKDVAHLRLYLDGKEITGSIGVVLKNGEELVTVTGIDAGTYPQPSIDTSKFQIESIEASNYEFEVKEFTPGTLTISPRPVTIKQWAQKCPMREPRLRKMAVKQQAL